MRRAIFFGSKCEYKKTCIVQFVFAMEETGQSLNPRFVAWPLELGLGTHNPRFVAWPLELGLGTHDPRFFAWPLELGLGTRDPRFVAWPLELGLGTHNPRFVAWPLELGLGTHDPRFVAWPLELGLGTRDPRFVVWPLELGLGGGGGLSAVRAQCNYWASGRTRDPCFEIIGAPRGILVTPSGGFARRSTFGSRHGKA